MEYHNDAEEFAVYYYVYVFKRCHYWGMLIVSGAQR